MQRALRTWSAGLASGIRRQGDLCLFWMGWLDKAEETRSLNYLERLLRPQLKARYEELAVQEEIKWRQRSRALWLRAGDANTRFFHRKATCRRSSNRISVISDGSSLLTSHADIAKHLHSYFSSQFGNPPPVRQPIDLQLLYGIDQPSTAALQLPFTEDEVKRAIFSSAAEKAPGPDGLPMIFYQRFWHILKDDILEVFEVFHAGSANLSNLNSSWICAIPKKTGTLTARDLRPISLVHGMSKLLSKVLAIRLQPLLPHLINPHQTAFIKGRHIMDNFFCAHFLVHHFHSSKTPAAVLKIDFERAFDQVNWAFLKEVLVARGFGDRWIQWIDSLLNSASAAVILNGVPGKPFALNRGLRQGDPLSPLLFIICMDVLYRMIQRATDEGFLPRMGVGECCFHTLQFADDILIFFDGTSRSAAIIKLILDGFSNSSGLKINYDKSSITPIHLPWAQTLSLGNVFACPPQDFPLRYLGLPLSPRKPRKTDFLPLIEKLDGRLAGWKRLTLSRGGRLVLLNSVLTGIPSYYSSAFRLPTWVSNYLEKLRRGFFWKGRVLNSGFHCLVKWENVCRPKRLGGVGIRSLRVANSALLMKGLWSFFASPMLPWVQFLWAKHYRLRPPASSGKCPHGCSPIWKEMYKMAAPFFTSIHFVLGDGKTVNFWLARWNGDLTFRFLLPNLYATSLTKKISVFKWLHRFAASPWAAFPQPLTLEEHTELQQLSSLISTSELSTSPDLIRWRWSSNGTFSSRSAYFFLMESGAKDGKINFLWKTGAPLRVKLFLWLAARNRLLTADTLAKRGWPGPSICVFCHRSDETLQHLLFECAFALSLWSRIIPGRTASKGRWLASGGNLPARWRLLRAPHSADDRYSLDLAFAATCWELWKERNERLFNNGQASTAELEGRVAIAANHWGSSHEG